MRTPAAILCLAVLIQSGCSHTIIIPQQTTSRSIADGLCPPVNDNSLKTSVDPPIGWKPDPVKVSANHRHQVWLSPTGDSAYGVIYFRMALPVGAETALWGFLREMKKTEGEATLISEQNDDTLPGIRFEAEGGLYRIRCNLTVDGFHGWVVYAGSLRSRPVNRAEIQKAVEAREQTRVDLP